MTRSTRCSLEHVADHLRRQGPAGALELGTEEARVILPPFDEMRLPTLVLPRPRADLLAVRRPDQLAADRHTKPEPGVPVGWVLRGKRDLGGVELEEGV